MPQKKQNGIFQHRVQFPLKSTSGGRNIYKSNLLEFWWILKSYRILYFDSFRLGQVWYLHLWISHGIYHYSVQVNLIKIVHQIIVPLYREIDESSKGTIKLDLFSTRKWCFEKYGIVTDRFQPARRHYSHAKTKIFGDYLFACCMLVQHGALNILCLTLILNDYIAD